MKSRFIYILIALYMSIICVHAHSDDVSIKISAYKDNIIQTINDGSSDIYESYSNACSLIKANPHAVDAYIPFFCDEEFIGNVLETVSSNNPLLFDDIVEKYYSTTSCIALNISLQMSYHLEDRGITIPNGHQTYSRLGDICAERNLYDEAIDLYSRALDLSIANELQAKYFYKIGSCNNQMKKPLQAIENFITAASLYIECKGIEDKMSSEAVDYIYEVFKDYVIPNTNTYIPSELKTVEMDYHEIRETIELVRGFFYYITHEYGWKSIDTPTSALNPIARCCYEMVMLNISHDNIDALEHSIADFFEYIIQHYSLQYTDQIFVDYTIEVSRTLENHGYGYLAKELLLGHMEDNFHKFESNERLLTEYIEVLIRERDYITAHEILTDSAFLIHDDCYGFEFHRRYWDINNLVLQLLDLVNIYIYVDSPYQKDFLTIIKRLIDSNCVGKNGEELKPEAIGGYYNALANSLESLEERIRYYEKSLEYGSTGKIRTLVNLAEIYSEQGLHIKADSLFASVIGSLDFMLADGQDKYRIYKSKIRNNLYTYDREEVNKYSRELFETTTEDFRRAAKTMTNSALDDYWNRIYGDFQTTITTAEGRFGNHAQLSYDAALFQKGVLLRNTVLRKNNIVESNDSTLIDAYQQFCHAQQSDISAVEDAEWWLMHYYSMHQEFLQGEIVPVWQDVRSTLGKGEIAIEFSMMEDIDENVFYYVALILERDSTEPILVKICKADELNETIEENKLSSGYSTVYDQYKDGENVLYSMIWTPLEEYIKEAKTIYFSPYQLLNFINIECLHKSEGTKCMSELYEIKRISTTGNIVRKPKTVFKNAALFGGIDYNISDEYQQSDEFSPSYSNDEYSYARACLSEWMPLANTLEEITYINEKLTGIDITADIYSGTSATEEVFKRISGQKKSIIHLATHGFYYTRENASMLDYFSDMNNKTKAGLLFSGANSTWLGIPVPEGVEDGILNTDEILGMDLSGTELLVLSACQTGLGDQYSDGIHGIQRSFKIAGVDSIIMSLWEVDDEATRIMMSDLYKHLSKGLSIKDSFDLAVKTVKRIYAKRSKSESRAIPKHRRHDSSYYWSSFILLD